MSGECIEVEIEAITGEEGDAARNQEVSQGMDDQVRRVLRAGAEIQHGQQLGARIDGQPQPQHLCGAAQPGSQQWSNCTYGSRRWQKECLCKV
jgi:hypothetical protein